MESLFGHHYYQFFQRAVNSFNFSVLRYDVDGVVESIEFYGEISVDSIQRVTN
ncbi:Uncharacterised protein [Vibrio cholerae]|nr:Uncharacterised protein [Vibrio cholerae]CSB87487.1 Uncharacterised protein [Vibrio cholerae]CSD68939.1 Uncharacterised protein [Vibrio cholerae]